MKESHFKMFMNGMYVVLIGIFGWAAYIDQTAWWKALCAGVLLSAVYFWIVRVTCNVSRRAGGFSPERGVKPASKG